MVECSIKEGFRVDFTIVDDHLVLMYNRGRPYISNPVGGIANIS